MAVSGFLPDHSKDSESGMTDAKLLLSRSKEGSVGSCEYNNSTG